MGLLDFLKGRKAKDGKDPEISNKKPYIFVSYALANADEVFRIIRQFQDRGYRVWYDKGIDPDDEKAERIENALENASLFLVFLTPESEALVNIRREIDYALNAGKPFLAIYLKETDLTGGLQLRLAAKQAILKYHMSDEEFFYQCSCAFERLGLFETAAIQPSTTESPDLTRLASDREETLNSVSDREKRPVPHYEKADRDYMRRFLQKASPIIYSIASDKIPLGSYASAELTDLLADIIGYEKRKQDDEGALQDLISDRQSLINLYGAVKKEPGFLPLYVEIGKLLRKYGLFDEEVDLLENAIAENHFNEADFVSVKSRLTRAISLRQTDYADMSEAEQIAEDLRKAIQKNPTDRDEIEPLIDKCDDDVVLYEFACNDSLASDLTFVRAEAARRIKRRDYQYALCSHAQSFVKRTVVLNLFETLKGDDLFIARTVLADPDDMNKDHVLLYCEDETLLMLGRLYVYGAGNYCAEKLHAIGSAFPEAYEEMDSAQRRQCEQDWLEYAAELVRSRLIPEDDAVRDRISYIASVDSEPLDMFLSIHHPRKAVRCWHAGKLENPRNIAYIGSWTYDDQIKEAQSVKINSTALITEMLFGDLSAADLVFAFRKPKDLTLQDRFCIEIMKNHPNLTIREHVRKELLRGNIEIPGADLSKPDSLYKDK